MKIPLGDIPLSVTITNLYHHINKFRFLWFWQKRNRRHWLVDWISQALGTGFGTWNTGRSKLSLPHVWPGGGQQWLPPPEFARVLSVGGGILLFVGLPLLSENDVVFLQLWLFRTTWRCHSISFPWCKFVFVLTQDSSGLQNTVNLPDKSPSWENGRLVSEEWS